MCCGSDVVSQTVPLAKGVSTRVRLRYMGNEDSAYWYAPGSNRQYKAGVDRKVISVLPEDVAPMLTIVYRGIRLFTRESPEGGDLPLAPAAAAPEPEADAPVSRAAKSQIPVAPASAAEPVPEKSKRPRPPAKTKPKAEPKALGAAFGKDTVGKHGGDPKPTPKLVLDAPVPDPLAKPPNG